MTQPKKRNALEQALDKTVAKIVDQGDGTRAISLNKRERRMVENAITAHYGQPWASQELKKEALGLLAKIGRHDMACGCGRPAEFGGVCSDCRDNIEACI